MFNANANFSRPAGRWLGDRGFAVEMNLLFRDSKAPTQATP